MYNTPKENNDKLSFKTEVDASKYNQEKYTIVEMLCILGIDIDNAAELSDYIEMFEEEVRLSISMFHSSKNFYKNASNDFNCC